MRKLLPALLAIALLCTLCACGGQSQPAAPADQQSASEPAAAPQPPAPAEPAPQEEPAEKPEETPAEPAEKPAEPAETPAEPAEKPAEPAEKPAEAPAEKPAEKPAPAKPAEDPKAIAQGLVGRPVSELYAAIGKPLSSDYAPSCLIDGDDGELTYDGFVVYTERGEGYETVYAVM